MEKHETVKTIDVLGKTWFDRVYGNSYFSARITINYGMPDSRTYLLPFQYGYGSQYEWVSMSELQRQGEIPTDEHVSLFTYCSRHGIILRSSMEKNCRKRDVVSWGKAE